MKDKTVRFWLKGKWMSVKDCIEQGMSIKNIKSDGTETHITTNDQALEYLGMKAKRIESKKEPEDIYDNIDNWITLPNQVTDIQSFKDNDNWVNLPYKVEDVKDFKPLDILQMVTRDEIVEQLRFAQSELYILRTEPRDISMEEYYTNRINFTQGEIHAYEQLLELIDNKNNGGN